MRGSGPNSCTDLTVNTLGLEPATFQVLVKHLGHYDHSQVSTQNILRSGFLTINHIWNINAWYKVKVFKRVQNYNWKLWWIRVCPHWQSCVCIITTSPSTYQNSGTPSLPPDRKCGLTLQIGPVKHHAFHLALTLTHALTHRHTQWEYPELTSPPSCRVWPGQNLRA